MSAASTAPTDLTDAQLQAVVALRQNTTYLWKSFVSLTDEKRGFTCPIRQATYQKIRRNLNTLCEAGFFEFNLIHETSGGDGSIIQLEISHISDAFKARIRTLPSESPPDAESEPLKPQSARPVRVARKPSSTRPLTERTAPRPDSLSPFPWLNLTPLSEGVARFTGRVGGMRLGLIMVGALLVLAGSQGLFHAPTSTTGEMLVAHLEPRTPVEPLKLPSASPKPAPEPPKPAPEPPKPAPEPPKPAPEPPKPAPEPPKPAPELPKPAPEPPNAPVEPIATAPVSITPVASAPPAAAPSRQLVTPAVFARQAIRFPVEREEPPVTPVTTVGAAQVVVDIPVLNLHPLPALQGEPIKSLTQGSELRVTWKENGWLRVTDTTQVSGWVLAYGTRDRANQHRISILDALSASSH